MRSDDTQRFNPDTPLADEEPDLLGREGFCSRIAEQICIPSGKPGLTFSIEGPWGFGKTSALNLIARQLAQDEQAIIVHFNPWMIGSVESLAQEFFLQMASAIDLSSHGKEAQKLTKSLTSYSSLFSVAKVIPGVEPWASLISLALKVSSEGTKAVADLTELNIAEQKKKVSEGIVKLGKPIVVFIDDMDRLMPKEVFAVIRLVKAISDFPQVAYVLAFDPPYVETALEKSGVSGGRAYLDKIIQVRIPLPPIGRKQISKIVDDELSKFDIDEALQYFPDEMERLQHLYQRFLRKLLRTPRDVYRVFNRLRLLYPSVKEEVGIADFLAIETIAMVAPPLYDHIREYPQAYTGLLDIEILQEPQKVVDQSKGERADVVEKCDVALQKTLSDLVGLLFPRTEMSFSGYSERHQRNTGRISNSKNLLIALYGGLPQAEISLMKIRAFVGSHKERQEILSEVASVDQLEDFLDLLNTHVASTPPVFPENLVEFLSEIAKLGVVTELNENRGFLKTDIATQIFWILRATLEGLSEEKSKALINTIFQNDQMLEISSTLLVYLRYQHGIPDESTREEVCLVGEEELETLTRQWAKSAIAALSSGAGWSSNNARQVFFTLREIDPAGTQENTRKHLENGPVAQDQLVRIIAPKTEDSMKGKHVHLTEEYILKFCDVELLRKVARERLADGNLHGSDLRAIYTSISTGEVEYFCDH